MAKEQVLWYLYYLILFSFNYSIFSFFFFFLTVLFPFKNRIYFPPDIFVNKGFYKNLKLWLKLWLCSWQQLDRELKRCEGMDGAWMENVNIQQMTNTIEVPHFLGIVFTLSGLGFSVKNGKWSLQTDHSHKNHHCAEKVVFSSIKDYLFHPPPAAPEVFCMMFHTEPRSISISCVETFFDCNWLRSAQGKARSPLMLLVLI